MVVPSRSASLHKRRAFLLLGIVFTFVFILGGTFHLFATPQSSHAAAQLSVTINAGYNLVVDSNVESPSTYAPSVATVMGTFCNTSTAGETLTNVQGFIGDFGNNTPGIYPSRDSTDAGFITEHPHLQNTGEYAFTHVGGRIGNADATRFIGDLAPGQCNTQYWHFSYPRRANPDNSGVAVWGLTREYVDDLWLEFDIWGTADAGVSDNDTWTMHHRNEISAMANKIQPNPNGQWFNTDTSIVQPGEVITSNGILYELGNINKGFDNDGDFLYDYNAWLQPIGDPSYDPSCFRLINTTGVLTVSRSGGNPDLIIPFNNQLYFTNLPEDNNGVRGVVQYGFIALDGPCSTTLTPYQEVASGADNEKFNADYGAGIPPVGSSEAEVTIDKSSSPNTVALGGNITYQMPLANTSATNSSPSLPLGTGAVPLVVSDTIPAGTVFVSASSDVATTLRYSTDNGATWTTTQPPAASITTVQWWLNDQLPPSTTGTATLVVNVPGGYTGPSFIENDACASFGGGVSFDCADTVTMVEGTSTIGDFVWRDNDGDAQKDTEPGLDGITVYLYWDKNGDGELDEGDLLISSQDTAGTTEGNYDFSNIPNGDYLVVVDTTDADIPTGYKLTTGTAVHPVTISAGGTDYNDADFGFGPSLAVDKVLVNGGGYEGNEVTYLLTVRNLRPGGGTSTANSCTYNLWASAQDPTSTESQVNKRWENEPAAYDAPNGTYALTDLANADDNIAVTGFSTAPQAGSIMTVTLLVYADDVAALAAGDSLAIDFYYNDVLQAPALVTRVGTDFNGVAGNPDLFTYDVTAFNGGAWDWTDFDGSLIDIVLKASKSGGSAGDMGLDAVGLQVATGEACPDAEPSDILNTVPLTDTFDNTFLIFESATPAETSVAGNLITWDNVGPIYPGESTQVEVTFSTVGIATPQTVLNTTCSTSSLFSDGLLANDGCASASGNITPTSAITGLIWSDISAIGWQAGQQGYEAGTDLGIGNVTVALYECVGLPDPPNVGNNRTCESSFNNGTWQLVGTTTTEANGTYIFPNLPDGYYYVDVAPGTIPGTPTISADADESSQSFCTDGECVAGDHTWQHPDADLDKMTTVDYTNGDIVDVNFGYEVAPALYGTVWEDNDGDGTRENGENGIGTVTVTLLDCGANSICGDGDDGATLTTSTTITGYYEFVGLTAGQTYEITVNDGTLPAGGSWTQTDDPDATQDHQHTTTVTAGQVSGSHDFGYTQTGTFSIGDMLYNDWDGDGIEDAGEEGIPNITMYLYEDSNGDGVIDPVNDALITSTSTDSTGFYEFTNLPNGDYIVVVDEDDADFPANHIQTGDPDEVGTCSLCSGTGSASISGASIDTVDFGYQPVGFSTIGDRVWNDANKNGFQDASEVGIGNITVTLYEDSDGNGIIDGNDAVVGVAVTSDGSDGNPVGFYEFTDLPAGNYIVDVDSSDPQLPTDGGGNAYILSTDNDPLPVSIGTGEEYLDADFGFAPAGIIGDTIYQDDNGNGQQDLGESGISGVTVYLCTSSPCTSGNAIATDVTDSSGYYEFDGLPEGDYFIGVDETTGGLGSMTQTGDPDVSSPCGGTAACDAESDVSLGVGQIDRSRDFGYQPSSIIGDYVWFDVNNDGVQDAGEAGIGNVTIVLTLQGGGVITTVTDSDGYYTFGDVPDGTHTVSVDTNTLPYTMVNTFDNSAVPDSSSSVTVSGGSVTDIDDNTGCTDCDLDVDFGYRLAGAFSLSGTVFFDRANNGGDYNTLENDAPYANVIVYLVDTDTGMLLASTRTNGAGFYEFTNLPAGNYRVLTNPNSTILNGATHTTLNPAGDNDGTAFENASIVASNVTNVDIGFFGVVTPTAVTLSNIFTSQTQWLWLALIGLLLGGFTMLLWRKRLS